MSKKNNVSKVIGQKSVKNTTKADATKATGKAKSISPKKLKQIKGGRVGYNDQGGCLSRH